jgi:hypothetical protein
VVVVVVVVVNRSAASSGQVMNMVEGTSSEEAPCRSSTTGHSHDQQQTNQTNQANGQVCTCTWNDSRLCESDRALFQRVYSSTALSCGRRERGMVAQCQAELKVNVKCTGKVIYAVISLEQLSAVLGYLSTRYERCCCS